MRIISITLALFVLIAGIAFTRMQNKGIPRIEKEEEVLSENADEEYVGEITENITQVNQNSSSYTQESEIIPTPPPVPASEIKFNLDNFIYPGSAVTESTRTTLSLEISEDPEKVISWYKDKITTENMNIKTFVTTLTNGNFLGKLSGVKTGSEINVEIQKDADESFVQVHINSETY